MTRILVAVGALLIAGSPAFGDEIRLKNGSVLQGRIVREDKDSVVIDLGRGRMEIARRNIVSIAKTEVVDPPPAPAQDAPPRRPAPGPGDAAPRTNRATPPPPAPPQPRKKREPPAKPKVVPLERTSPSSGSTGPEATAPSRKSATRAASGGNTASKPARPAPKTDW